MVYGVSWHMVERSRINFVQLNFSSGTLWSNSYLNFKQCPNVFLRWKEGDLGVESWKKLVEEVKMKGNDTVDFFNWVGLEVQNLVGHDLGHGNGLGRFQLVNFEAL